MKKPLRIFAVLTSLLSLAACGGIEELNSTTQAVRNGAIDTTHTNVARIEVAGSLCTGVVVSPTTVLTAAHCIEAVTSFDRALVQVNGVQRVSADIELHPQYHSASLVPGGLPVFANSNVPGGFVFATTIDLGLIHVTPPLTGVTPASLSEDVFGLEPTGTIVGYGQHNNGAPQLHRRSGPVNLLFRTPLATVRDGEVRLSALAGNLHASSGSGGTIGCPGDSGGPIFNSLGQVIAILTGGDSPTCNGANIITTTYVSAYTSWILGGPPHQNPVDRMDVDDDGFLAPKDVLVLVTALNNGGGGFLAGAPSNGRYLDVSGDGYLTPSDVQIAVGQINNSASPGSGLAPPPIELNSLTYTLEGDANQDGCVDLADFSILSANFGNTVSLGPPEGDFTLDNVVDLADFTILSGNMGDCM